jgi:transcriptional antiterminator RfaH
MLEAGHINFWRTNAHFGEQLAFIGDNFIQELKSQEIDGEIVHSGTLYVVGQRVEVTGGTFSGLIGTIIRMDDKDRLVVLMNLLSRPVKVHVAARKVVAA